MGRGEICKLTWGDWAWVAIPNKSNVLHSAAAASKTLRFIKAIIA
jgi:hypothetical protein